MLLWSLLSVIMVTSNVAGQCAASVAAHQPADAGFRLQQGHHQGLDEWPNSCICIVCVNRNLADLLHLSNPLERADILSIVVVTFGSQGTA